MKWERDIQMSACQRGHADTHNRDQLEGTTVTEISNFKKVYANLLQMTNLWQTLSPWYDYLTR